LLLRGGAPPAPPGEAAPVEVTPGSGAGAGPGSGDSGTGTTGTSGGTSADVAYHTEGLVQTRNTKAAAQEVFDTTDARKEQIESDIATIKGRFQDESNSTTATAQLAQIAELKVQLAALRTQRNKAQGQQQDAASREEWHEKELAQLNAKPPVDVAAKVEEATKEVKAQAVQDREKLDDHIKFNALQAKNLAFQNKMLLDKISTHTDDIELEKAKQKLADRIKNNEDELARQQQIENTAQNAVAAADARTKINAINILVPQLKTQLEDLKKPVNREEDPIMALTPKFRIKVIAKREEVKTLKTAMADKVSKYDEDLKNLNDSIKQKEDEIAAESDAVKLAVLDKKLNEWQVAKVDMAENHQTSLASDQAKLEQAEKAEKAMIMGQPAAFVTTTPEGGPDQEEVDGAESAMKGVEDAAKRVTVQLATVEQATVKQEMYRALVLRLDTQIGVLEKQHAEEPSAEKAKGLKVQYDQLKAKRDETKNKLAENTSHLADAKELSGKRQRQAIFAQEEAKTKLTSLQDEANGAASKSAYKDTELAVAEMQGRLTDVASRTKGEIEVFNKEAEEKEKQAAEASKAVEDALKSADDAAKQVEDLASEVASEEDPEELKNLQAKLAAAKQAETTANTNLERSQAAEKAQMTAILSVGSEGMDEKERELAAAVAAITAAREELKDKKLKAQEATVKAASDDTPDALEKKTAAESAVTDAEDALKKLDDKEAHLKEVIALLKSQSSEQSAEEEEAAAKKKAAAAKMEADKQQAEALEAEAEKTRMAAENKELKTRLSKLEKNLTPNEAEIDSKENAAAQKMKEEIEAKDAKVAYEHAVENMKHANQRASRLKNVVGQETTSILNMKVRIRKLHNIKGKVMDENALASLDTNIKEENLEEKRLEGTLKGHVADEHRSEKEAEGYKKSLEDAKARQQGKLKAIADKEKQDEEQQADEAAMENVRERARSVATAEYQKRLLQRSIDDAKAKLTALTATGASPEEIKAAEAEITNLSMRQASEETKAQVMKARVHAAQLESVKVQALQPLEKARTELKDIQLRCATRRKDVQLFRDKLNTLAKDKVELSRKLIASQDEHERLKLHTAIAKNTGLAQAAHMNMEDALKRRSVVEKSKIFKLQEIRELEIKRDEVIRKADPAIRSEMAEKALSEAKAQAELNAKTEAEKAAAAQAQVQEKATMSEHDVAVSDTIKKILAKATVESRRVPMPGPSPPPPGAWQWHGPKPDDGALPPVPAQTQLAQLQGAAAQSAVNLQDGSAAATAAEVAKTRAQDANDQAEVAAMNAKLDNAQKAGQKQDAADDAAMSTVNGGLLDTAVSFVQKWVWNGDVPDTGKPEIPKFLKVAAGEKVDPPAATAAELPSPDAGPLEQAEEATTDGQKKVEEAKAETAASRAQVVNLEANLDKANPEDAPEIQKRLNTKKQQYAKDKEKMNAAKQNLDIDRMQLQETKVGAGKEDPDKAIENVKREKEMMAERKLKAAKDKVEEEKEKKDEAKAKKEETKNTEEKMEQVENSASSPAVKSAAASMESQESSEELNQVEEEVAAKKSEQQAEEKMKAEQEEEGADIEKTDKAAADATSEADMAKEAAKTTMDFEGNKYSKAIKKSVKHQINAAKLNAVWHNQQQKAKTSSSWSEGQALREEVTKLKKQEKEEMTQVLVQQEEAKVAVLNQHQVAKDLDKQLESFVAEAVAGKENDMSPQEEAAKEAHEVALEESKEETDQLKLAREQVAGLDKKLSKLQVSRLQDEDKKKDLKARQVAIKGNPIPELPKGVAKEVPKGVKAIERQKEKQMQKQVGEIKKDEKQKAKDEVQVALDLEKAKAKVKTTTQKAAALTDKADHAERQLEKAEEQKTKDQYGAQAVLKKAQQEAATSAAKRAIEKVKLETKEQMNPEPTDEEKEEQAVKDERKKDEGKPVEKESDKPKAKKTGIDKKISAEKMALSALTDKLKSLKAKITPSEESAAAPAAAVSALPAAAPVAVPAAAPVAATPVVAAPAVVSTPPAAAPPAR